MANDFTVGQMANRAHGLELAAKVLRNCGCNANASSCEEAAGMLRDMIKARHNEPKTKPDKIMVTVTAPEGLRAVVYMSDAKGGRCDMQEAVVVGGTSQQFFADAVRRITVGEGLPHCMTDALDRKLDDEKRLADARDYLSLGKDEPLF